MSGMNQTYLESKYLINLIEDGAWSMTMTSFNSIIYFQICDVNLNGKQVFLEDSNILCQVCTNRNDET